MFTKKKVAIENLLKNVFLGKKHNKKRISF